jgi:hypothetical protein
MRAASSESPFWQGSQVWSGWCWSLRCAEGSTRHGEALRDIARIGEGQPFRVGQGTTLTAPAGSELRLRVNDSDYVNNTGQFSVRVRTA